MPELPTSTATSAGVAGSEPAPIGHRIFRYRLLWVIALCTFAADQLSKYWVRVSLPYRTYGENGGAIPVIRGFWYFVHAGNTCPAWTLFSGRSLALPTL